MAREMAQKKIQGTLNRNTFSVPGTSMETSISTMVKEKPGAEKALMDLIQRTQPGTYVKNPSKVLYLFFIRFLPILLFNFCNVGFIL